MKKDTVGICLLLIFSLATTILFAEGAKETPKPGGKKPVPSEASQKEIFGQIDEVYSLSEVKTTDAKIKLAKELFGLAKQSNTTPNQRFVLLSEAMKLAQDAGDLLFTLKVVDALDADFDMDSWSLRYKILAQFKVIPRNLEQANILIAATQSLSDQAMAEERYDMAIKLVDALYQACRYSSNREARKAALELRASVKELSSQFQKVQYAREKLKKTPDDPNANFIVGHWLCFAENDWKQGLPYLAKGNDNILRKQAELELMNPQKLQDQMDLADSWWEAKQTAKGEAMLAMALRAKYWYEKAAKQADNVLVKAKIEKRLSRTLNLKPPRRMKKIPQQFVQMNEMLNDFSNWSTEKGDWQVQDNKLIGSGDSSLKFKYNLPADFILEFKMNVLDGMRPRIHFREFFFGNEGYSMNLSIPGSKFPKEKLFTYKNNQELVIRLTFRGEDVSLFINGRLAGEAKRKQHQPETLTLSGGDGWSPGKTAYYDFQVSPIPK